MNGATTAPRPLPWKWTHCATCVEYAGVRASAIAKAIGQTTRRTGKSEAAAALERLMTGVHARHLAGLPILPGATS